MGEHEQEEEAFFETAKRSGYEGGSPLTTSTASQGFSKWTRASRLIPDAATDSTNLRDETSGRNPQDAAKRNSRETNKKAEKSNEEAGDSDSTRTTFHSDSQEHAEFFPMYTVHLEALLEMAEILPHEAGLFSEGFLKLNP